LAAIRRIIVAVERRARAMCVELRIWGEEPAPPFKRVKSSTLAPGVALPQLNISILSRCRLALWVARHLLSSSSSVRPDRGCTGGLRPARLPPLAVRAFFVTQTRF
jgi:hypothetical protein